jgi:hypothetical protein
VSVARFRGVSATLLLVAGAAVAVLHVVSPDLDPRRSRLSQYANGPYGWLMTVAFLAVGTALFALAVTLHANKRTGWRPRQAPMAVAVAGVGMVVSGLVATDPESANSIRETVHSQSSGLAVVALVAVASAWVIVGRRVSGGWCPSAAAAATAGAATIVAVVSPWLHRSSWTGLSQRALWAAVLAWLFAVLHALRPPGDISGDLSPVSARRATIDA